MSLRGSRGDGPIAGTAAQLLSIVDSSRLEGLQLLCNVMRKSAVFQAQLVTRKVFCFRGRAV